MRSGYNSSYTSGVSVTGAWAAKVVSVDNDKHLSVKIPRLGGENVYTEVYYSGITPSAGDEIWVTPIEGKPGKLLAITGSPDISGIEGDVAQLQIDTAQLQIDLGETSDSVDAIDVRLTTVEETTIPALDTRITALEEDAPEWKYKTTTSFAISDDDNADIIETYDSATETVISIPQDDGSNFTDNIQVAVIRGGDGNVTFNPDSGVTLNSPNSNLSIKDKYGKVDLFRKAKDVWYLSGDLTDLTAWEIVGSPITSPAFLSVPTAVDMSSDGTIIAVAERNVSQPSGSRGQVRVFEETYGFWSQRGSTITSATTYAFPTFGWQIAMSSDGSKIVVSAPDQTPYGEITTYIWNGSDYALSHTLSNPSTRANVFGNAFDMTSDGNWMVVASQSRSTDTTVAGEVFLYQWSSGSWSLFDTISVSTQTTYTSAYTGFGFSVAISDDGEVIAVGEPLAEWTPANTFLSYILTGKVNIYERLSLSLNLRDEIYYDTEDARAGFDCDLSSDGSILVVGSLNERASTEPGSVRVFEYDAVAGAWYKLGPDLSGAEEGDHFGYSVTLNSDGTTIVVGSPYSDYTYVDSGAIYVYDWNAEKFTWEQRGKTIVAQTPPVEEDMFGFDVAADSNGDRVIGCALLGESGTGVNYGSTEVWEWPTGDSGGGIGFP